MNSKNLIMFNSNTVAPLRLSYIKQAEESYLRNSFFGNCTSDHYKTRNRNHEFHQFYIYKKKKKKTAILKTKRIKQNR